jgi:Pilus formation protein N terminal region
MQPRLRTIFVGITLAASMAISPAMANDLIVKYDQAQLLRLPRPITEVIIGNPTIAEVTVQGGNMLVVTGKTFGVTNIIALDADHNIIQDQRVVVQQDDQRIVHLVRGAARESYSCTPTCTSTLTIGDDPLYFDRIHKTSTSKTTFSSDDGVGGGGAPTGGGQ